MKVTLIARTIYTGHDTPQHRRARDDQMIGTNAEILSEMAGRICYDSFGAGRDSEQFHQHISESAHVNVLYHPHFSLLIEGVSRNLTHELVRHHVGFSPSMRSTRFVDESRSPVVHHPAVQRVLDAGGEAAEELADALATLDAAFRQAYTTTARVLGDLGHDKKTARGAASRCLPNGIATNLVWTGNLQAFRSMMERRSVPGVVDEEFVQLTVAMSEVLHPLAPLYIQEIVR